MVFSSSAAAWLGRREWAGGQPAVASTLGIILIKTIGKSPTLDFDTTTTSRPRNLIQHDAQRCTIGNDNKREMSDLTLLLSELIIKYP